MGFRLVPGIWIPSFHRNSYCLVHYWSFHTFPHDAKTHFVSYISQHRLRKVVHLYGWRLVRIVQTSNHWHRTVALTCPGIPRGVKRPLKNSFKTTFMMIRSVTNFILSYQIARWPVCCVMSLGVLNSTPNIAAYLHQSKGFSHLTADLELL